MTEQTTLKIAGSEIPYGALQDPLFWVLVLVALVAAYLIRWGR